MDEKKKSPEEEKNKEAPENPEHEKPEGEKEEQKPEEKPKDEKPEEKASDDKQADENGEGADKPEEKADNPEEKKDEAAPAADPKDEEILKLKTQIAAMQMGFNPECMEDAVVLAESYVKSGAQKDINTALSAVMKKYPDWKAEGGKSNDKKQGGFRVGAGGADKQESADNDKLSKAFGIKKNKK